MQQRGEMAGNRGDSKKYFRLLFIYTIIAS
mgnify:CR=1 FL=1